jgi:hypothetical protein
MTKQQIIVTLIISIVATGLIELLKPAFKALWAWMNRPTPLTLQGKVALANQVELQELQLERLNHLSRHSKDVYLYLFKLGLAIFMLVSAAVFLFFYTVYEPLSTVLSLFLLFTALLFCFVAFVEADRLSAKNIEATKAKVEKFISEGRAKLNIPS